jgi:cytochrome c-type biogenesis protein CcmH
MTGRVEISAPALAALPPTAVVVLSAYAVDGPRLPLATLQRPASALPMDFQLDDSMAVNPAFRLSMAAQVVVGARITATPAAPAQAGDWVGVSAPVAPGAQEVRVLVTEQMK